MDSARRSAPATLRNREPILAVLERVVPPREGGARVLEIACGTGEHATFLAERLPVASWQPTDPDPTSRASTDAWREHLGATRVLPARDLDVHAASWPLDVADLVVCINMIHISPWSATEALFRGAARVLPPGGLLYLYGPYRRGGAHTAPSNEAFDASLRTRDPSWGVRDLEAILAEGEKNGLVLFEPDGIVAMPANNFSVVLRRT